MKQNNKRLGDFIRLVDERNVNLEEKTLLGVSIQKKLMPSIANTVGTDMSRYKIIRKNQFAYGTVTSRNGEKVSIALLKEFESAIVSQIYLVFEIKDEEVLLPDYLMMWFRRPEFDRYARFKSHGSARETFDWEEMCEVEIPVLSIEKQREIVSEYQAVEQRIKLNETLCQKLEETAQTLYRHWFEDFEFPLESQEPRAESQEMRTDNQQPTTKPYKSSGGKMVYSEELGKEIPEGWSVGKLGDFVILSQGKQVEVDEQFFESEGRNRFVRIIDYTPNTEELPRYVDIFDDRYFCKREEISIIRYGDAGKICRGIEGIIANNLFKVSPKGNLKNNFLYYFLISKIIQQEIRAAAASSTMPAITHTAIKELKILIPNEWLWKEFEDLCIPIERQIFNLSDININLKKLKSLLLGKMAVGI